MGQKSIPQELKPNPFSILCGAAEAAPIQNNPKNDSFWTGS
jgi:hypothetical protein